VSAVTEAEFEVDGNHYRATRLSVFDQQTIASKLGGVLLLMGDGAADEKAKKTPTAQHFVRAFCALSADMRKSDSDLVMGLCLSKVTRKQSGDLGWAPIRIDGGLVAFEDINLNEMLLIVWHVLKQHRIPDFFSEPPSTSKEAKAGSK
jgi:hypothetical protein